MSREVWLAAGTQDLYGQAVVGEVEAHVREVAAALGMRDRGAVRSAEEIRRLCLDASADDDCIGLAVWMHTFSPAQMWVAGLSLLAKPLLHLHTQFNRELPWAEIDMEFMNVNQSAHGDRELAHLLTRAGVRRSTVVGHWQDPALRQRVGTWTRAARGRHELRRLTVARFGDNMRRVAVTEGDKVAAQLHLGFAVEGFGVGELVDDVAGVAEAQVDALVSAYHDDYDVAADMPAASLQDAARIELGLRTFLEAHGCLAFTDTFEDLGALRQLPGIGVQRLMADGYGFGAEGDWQAAAMLRAVKVMADGLPGGSSFMEDYTYDFAAGLVLGAHMLEVCPSLAGDRPSCELHRLAIGGRDDPVRLVFTARPGPAVVASLVDLSDRFRLVVNEIELLPLEQPLPRLPVARAVWRPQPDLQTASRAWLEAGGSHHTVLTQALDVQAFVDLAEMTGTELVHVR